MSSDSLFGDLQIVEMDGADVMTWRPFSADAGQEHEGHSHLIGHATLLVSGAVSVDVDGKWSGTYFAPATIFVPAEKKHTFRAIQDGTRWLCVFLPPVNDTRDLRTLSMEA